MLIMGYELPDIDVFDADIMEKTESASRKVIEECKSVRAIKKPSEAIRKQCGAVAEFIDTLFGEGTAVKIFKGKTNLMQSIQAFEEITEAINKSRQEQSEELQRLLSRYSPKRASRESK